MNWLMLFALLMAAATTAAVVMPLLRKPKAPSAPRTEYDLAVYKDQLAEIARDLERGLIQPAEAEAATVEVQRRMLAAADAESRPDGKSRAATRALWLADRRRAAVAVAALVPVAAFVLYGLLGSPDMPGQPFAGRDLGREQTAHGGQESGELSALADRLAEKMKQRPDDANGWLLLGRTYVTVGRFPEALAALKRALDLSGGNPAVAALYGETLVISRDGRMTPEAMALFRDVAKADPTNPQARFYIALGLAQEGKTAEALQAWVDLKALTPEDAPWAANLNEQIETARKELNLPSESLLPSPEARELAKTMPPAMPVHPPAAAPGVQAPGPSAADVEAARQMNPDAQQQMIQGMVQRLADRLKQNPDDLEGWRRLARAYEVLGDEAKAKEANARVEALENRQASTRPGAAAATQPPGPSAADVEAARRMAPEAQQQMIRGMVQRLADRLKQNPDDLEGWRRLARAYEVLGDAAKAKEANTRVKALEKKAR
jgi:cytochrome c-type biogenesis protein CcmH